MKSLIFLILAMVLAPFYAALILKVKAFFGGKKGPPLLINYYTLVKLLKKGSVYSTSTTFIFKMGPMVSLCAAVMALLFLPIAGQPPLFSFNSPHGMCVDCNGLGSVLSMDESKIIPDKSKSIREGAVVPWANFVSEDGEDQVRAPECPWYIVVIRDGRSTATIAFRMKRPGKAARVSCSRWHGPGKNRKWKPKIKFLSRFNTETIQCQRIPTRHVSSLLAKGS